MEKKFTMVSSTGKEIACRRWYGEEQPKAIIQLVHGMEEHIGRYAHFAEFLAEKRFSCCWT